MTVAAVIAIAGAVLALASLVTWALARFRARRARESWVSLDELERNGSTIEPRAERADPDRDLGSDGASAASADADRVSSDALASTDGIVALIGTDRTILAMTEQARAVLGAGVGRQYTDLGRCRPVASADGFEPAEHPVARALAGECIDRAPVVIATVESDKAGLVTARSVEVSGVTRVLVVIDLAVAESAA